MATKERQLTPFERLTPDAQRRKILISLHCENKAMAVSDLGEMLGVPNWLIRPHLAQLTVMNKVIVVTTGRGPKYKPALRDPLSYYLRKRR